MDRSIEGETSYLDALIGEEEQTRKRKKRKGIEAEGGETYYFDVLIGEEE